MIGVLYTITNKTGDSFSINDHVTDPDNFIALQSHPDFSLSIRSSRVPLQGQHGVVQNFSYYGGRTIVFQGVIVGEDEASVIAIRDQMQNVLKLPAQPSESDPGDVTISFTDPTGRALSMVARLDAAPQFDRDLGFDMTLRFQITLFSKQISFVGSTVQTQSGTHGWRDGLLTVPFQSLKTTGFTIGSVWRNKVTINNGGNTSAKLTARLYGSDTRIINKPKVLNITNGLYFQVDTTLNSSLQYVEINAANGTVVDHNGNDLSAYIVDGSSFVNLDVGDNDIVYLSEDNDTSNGFEYTINSFDDVFELEWQDTIL